METADKSSPVSSARPATAALGTVRLRLLLLGAALVSIPASAAAQAVGHPRFRGAHDVQELARVSLLPDLSPHRSAGSDHGRRYAETAFRQQPEGLRFQCHADRAGWRAVYDLRQHQRAQQPDRDRSMPRGCWIAWTVFRCLATGWTRPPSQLSRQMKKAASAAAAEMFRRSLSYRFATQARTACSVSWSSRE
jgi:hypothetical protein